jgi:hypothetical protein
MFALGTLLSRQIKPRGRGGSLHSDGEPVKQTRPERFTTTRIKKRQALARGEFEAVTIRVAPLHQGQDKRHRYVEEVRALLARIGILR